MRVGFVGIGKMGRHMAARLVNAGFPLTVHDVRSDAVKALADMGAVVADSPRRLAEQCEIICSCLPGPAEMEPVAIGPDGILEGIRPGSVYVDHTTNSPILVRRVQRMMLEKGASMLDAPVSGGVTGAEKGTLTIQVGGAEGALERCRPVLSAMASTVLRVGDIGAGCICKITHNCAVFSANLAMMECLTLGVKAGVDPSTLVELFQKSGIGRNHDLQVSLPVTLFQGVFEPRFALQTAAKDMGLAAELARAFDLPMRVTGICAQEMDEAMARGWAEKDHSIYLTIQEERAGVQIRVRKDQPAGPKGEEKTR